MWFRLLEKIKDVRKRVLSTPPDMPSWIYFDPRSTPSVVAALDYWLKAAPKKTVKGILKYHEYKSPNDLYRSATALSTADSGIEMMAQANRSSIEQQVGDFIDAMSDADLQDKPICPPGIPMSEARALIKMSMVQDFLEEHIAGGREEIDVFEKEVNWYKKMNCFYPPRELEKRHPGLVALKKQVTEQQARGQRPNPDKQVLYVVRIASPFPPFTSFHEPGGLVGPDLLKKYYSRIYYRPIRNIMRLGKPTSRSL